MFLSSKQSSAACKQQEITISVPDWRAQELTMAWETKLSYQTLNFPHDHTVNFWSSFQARISPLKSHERFLWAFLRKIFNFYELSGFDYFRKWAVTGHGIGDWFQSMSIEGEVGAQVCSSCRRFKQCYSTNPKKTET